MAVICVLITTKHLPGADFHTHDRALMEPARESPGDEEVEKGSEGATLTGACGVVVELRNVAIDDCTS